MTQRQRFSETLRRDIRNVKEKPAPFLPAGSDFVVTNPAEDIVTTNNGADNVIVTVI